MAAFEIVARSDRDRLGEGPVWLEHQNQLAWVDIVGQRVHRLDLSTGSIRSLEVPEPIGWIVPRMNDRTVVAGLKSGFAFLDLDSGAVRAIFSPEKDRPDNRLNDAKVDMEGRIWAGSKDDTDRASSGALYRLGPDLSCQRMDDGYGVTNGPTFSPDGGILYHTDSAARTVFAFDLSPDGELANKRIWLRFEDEWGYPDGMTTDVEGCLWIAHWGGSGISRFDPTGQRMDHVALPATNITSCAFAGPNLDRLFVTSSTIDCEGEAAAGALFEVRVDTTGFAPNRFAG